MKAGLLYISVRWWSVWVPRWVWSRLPNICSWCLWRRWDRILRVVSNPPKYVSCAITIVLPLREPVRSKSVVITPPVSLRAKRLMSWATPLFYIWTRKKRNIWTNAAQPTSSEFVATATSLRSLTLSCLLSRTRVCSSWQPIWAWRWNAVRFR